MLFYIEREDLMFYEYHVRFLFSRELSNGLKPRQVCSATWQNDMQLAMQLLFLHIQITADPTYNDSVRDATIVSQL
jgi:hypothetical protein